MKLSLPDVSIPPVEVSEANVNGSEAAVPAETIPEAEPISTVLAKVVEREINKIIPKPLKAKEIPEPDWANEASIKAYIEALNEDVTTVTEHEKFAYSKRMDANEVRVEVEKVLQQAIGIIQAKQLELQSDAMKAEARRRDDNAKIAKANEYLADLLATQSQLEHLAELERQLKELCADFDAWGKARPYQVDSILLAVQNYKNGKRGFLDADDMGLGKTFKATVTMFILTAMFIAEHHREPKILWVTKKSLIKSNLREISKWNQDIKAVPNLGSSPAEREGFLRIALMTNSMMICSYENVRDTDIIRNTKWDFVFADEVHKLKGGASKKPTLIWSVMKELCAKTRYMYWLSGTPIVNKGEEMWSYLHIFEPEKFASLNNFLFRYMDAYYDQNGNPQTKVNVSRLMNALAGQMIHRTKLEVGFQMPDKTREFYYLTMGDEQRKVYDQMRDNLYVWLDTKDQTKMLSANVIIAQINRLRQIALYPKSLHTKDAFGQEVYLDVDESVKVDQAFDLIEQIGEQVVVFSAQFNDPIFELARRCKDAGYRVETITGGKGRDSGDIEEDFQNGLIDVLIINMQTGSEGLNLHKSPEDWKGGASHAIFLDLWWSPAKNVQAEDRIWRPGVKEPVTIHILQCEDSADAFVAAKVEEKDSMIAGIMDQDTLRPPSEWRELLEGLI